VDGLACAPVRRGLQNCGAAEAAVGKEHGLPETVGVTGGNDIGRNAGEVRKILMIGSVEKKRNESGTRRDDVDGELTG